jgi:hypothetical protein
LAEALNVGSPHRLSAIFFRVMPAGRGVGLVSDVGEGEALALDLFVEELVGLELELEAWQAPARAVAISRAARAMLRVRPTIAITLLSLRAALPLRARVCIGTMACARHRRVLARPHMKGPGPSIPALTQ